MKRKLFLFMSLFIFIFAAVLLYKAHVLSQLYGAPPYIADEGTPDFNIGKFGDLTKWKRPEGPLRVGLQVGHWKNSELPDELKVLRETGGGTSDGNGISEWQVNLKIAEKTREFLESDGIVVDILPATIPPGYYADAVVAIHADGNLNPAKNGFKVAAPRTDFSGKAQKLVDTLQEEYAADTNLPIDYDITRNMTGYYAFAWRRFEHSTHPMAPAVILETGFLTNPEEAYVLINNPEVPAEALSKALIKFLKS